MGNEISRPSPPSSQDFKIRVLSMDGDGTLTEQDTASSQTSNTWDTLWTVDTNYTVTENGAIVIELIGDELCLHAQTLKIVTDNYMLGDDALD